MSVLIMFGFPVTFILGGVAMLFGVIGFGWDFFNLLPLRVWGRMSNVTLMAVPLFVFMGVMLERSGLADKLLDAMGLLMGRLRGGLAASVVVGALFGRQHRHRRRHGGYHGAAGRAHHAAPRLFKGNGLRQRRCFRHPVAGYFKPDSAPTISREEMGEQVGGHLMVQVMVSMVPPLFLMIAVLGPIFAGIASPTEAAAVGAVGKEVPHHMFHSAIVVPLRKSGKNIGALKFYGYKKQRLSYIDFEIANGLA